MDGSKQHLPHVSVEWLCVDNVPALLLFLVIYAAELYVYWNNLRTKEFASPTFLDQVSSPVERDARHPHYRCRI